MKDKNIAFDLDGVIYNFMGPFDSFVLKLGHPLEDDSQYRITDRYNIPNTYGSQLLENFGKERPFLSIPLYKKSKEEMIKLSKDNEIYIITYRDWASYGVEDTIKRITKDELPVKHENIIFAKDKGLWAKRLNIDLFYEDSLSNAEDILRSSNSLVKLVDAPYNQSDKTNAERIKW